MAGIFRRAWFPPQKKRFSARVTTASVDLLTGLGTVIVTGYAPAVSTGTAASVEPGVGSVTITGYLATFATGTGNVAQPGLGTVTITGHAPVFSTQPPAMLPGLGTVTITGLMPTVTGIAGASLAPGLGRLTIFGYQPTVFEHVLVSGGAADPRRKWLDWKAQQKRKRPEAKALPPAIPPGTLSFSDLLSYLDAERQAAALSGRPLTPEEQALDDMEVERLLMEDA